ncbi:MAG: ROK family protein [Deltaproteobacteria bacterium]|nr:MAG: ROK family protein [Deltaproteobacteria bacterium]
MAIGRVAGVDVGGSGVRLRAGSEGDIARVELVDREVDTVIAAVERLLPPGVEALGVAVPGFLDGEVVRASPNFPSWRDVPLAARLRDRLGIPVAIENDATAAALGAHARRGASEDLVLLTLGTGVGGGAVLGGRALRGRTGSAGELGHLFAGGEQPCGCGATGCLETWVSTSGWQRRTGRADLDGRQVVEAAAAGEGWALDLLAQGGQALGRAARTIANFCDPDVLVLAGGLTAARPWLEPHLTEGLSRAAAPMAARIQVVWMGRADGLAIEGAQAAALRLLAQCGDLPA